MSETPANDRTAEVVSIKGKAPVNAELVADIRDLLAQVESGNIQALAYAAARRDHARVTYWKSKTGYSHDLTAGVLHLHHRVGRVLMGSPEAEDL